MSESQTSISSLEVTRNPFESDVEERLNYPGFSPSMFTAQRTPVSQCKTKEFRWSIEQISRLYPADVDECPNQEYSSTYERVEDEKAAQEAIEEYFSQDAIVPSPWTPNRSAKKVTFSPLPPDTQYIDNCTLDSTYSQNNSLNVQKADACTQTLWSIPFNAVQLDEILGKAYETYLQNTSDDSRNLSSSSLRRNLFPIDEQAHEDTDKNNNLTPSSTKIRSILKPSKSPVLATSSPLSSKLNYLKEKSKSPGTQCLDVSPIRISPLNKLKQRNLLDSPANINPVKLLKVNVLESSGIENELQMFPDISPIKDNGEAELEAEWSQHNSTEISSKKMNGTGINEQEASAQDMNQPPENDYDDNEIDSDDVKPAKITMEDLATDSDIDESDDADNDDADNDDADNDDNDDDDKPPNITMEDLSTSSNIDAKPPSITMDDLSVPSDSGKKQVDSDEAMEMSTDNAPRLTSEECMVISEVSFSTEQAIDNNPREQYYNDLDEDLIMVKAAAALRRANRFAHISGDSYEAQSNKPDFSLSELPWQPVDMSTPLNVPTRSRAYGTSLDNNHKDCIRTQESNVYSCYYGDSVNQGSNGSKRLSPVMEDIIRRQGVLKSTLKEVQSDSWMKPTSPSYQTPIPGKWRTPRTYPLSKVERKVLYGKPTTYRVPECYRDPFSPQLYSDFVRYESKRTSWPPTRSVLLRSSYSRPLSPTYWQTTGNKVYSTYPEGSVAKMPIPASHTFGNIEGGFDEWKKVISRNERSMRIENIKSFY